MEKIHTTLRDARQNKGLSQSELGALVGLPQSHISKIEKGGTDIKLSSLVQLARALDLELQLVPKRALPAVESVVRSVAGFPRDRTQPAQAEIARIKRTLEAFGNAVQLDPNLQEKLESISHVLDDVREQFIDTDAFVRIRKVSEQIQEAVQNNPKLDQFSVLLDPETLKAFASADRNLRNLRNELKHLDIAPSHSRPAYRLEEDADE